MTLLPILKDNYVPIMTGAAEKPAAAEAIVVDPGEAEPVVDFLRARGLRLALILITHHHGDHVGGARALLDATEARIVVPARDRGMWNFPREETADEGTIITEGGFRFETFAVPGHTLDHVAYFEPTRKWLFVGDTIFGLGCGRLFEGTPEQMFASLQRLRSLPDETLVFCAHEYTETNLLFTENARPDFARGAPFQAHAQTIRERRRRGEPTVPLRLGDEKRMNLLLGASTPEEFRELRRRRDEFQAPRRTT